MGRAARKHSWAAAVLATSAFALIAAPQRSWSGPSAPEPDSAAQRAASPRDAPRPSAIAAENEAAARAALDALERGGSAVDGAIAASAMLDVTAPVSCGLGGGGFALVYDAHERRFTFLDYRETAPSGFDPRAFAAARPGAKVGVPGEVAGLYELSRRWGRLSFAEGLGPAIRAAVTGFSVGPHLGGALAELASKLSSPGLGALFPLASRANGMWLRNPALGATLQRIATEGPRAFYEGAVANDLVDTVREAGGSLSVADLEGYRPVLRDPLRGRWEGFDIVTAPAPSAGGLLLLETLGLYSKQELAALGLRSANYDHFLAEAFRGALADRVRTMGDPALVRDPAAELLQPQRLRERRKHISQDLTHAPPLFGLVEHGTTHVVVADAEGNIVALTTTINSPLGAGLLAPRSGVLLNDELDDFTMPAIAESFGRRDGPNAPRAGARPVSSMTPTVVLRDGSPVLALGGSGGMRIAENVTQVVLARLAFGESLDRAVSAPRFFVPLSGPQIFFSARDRPAAPLERELADKGEQVRFAPEDTSAVQAIAFGRDPAGRLVFEAAADPRKHGVAIVR